MRGGTGAVFSDIPGASKVHGEAPPTALKVVSASALSGEFTKIAIAVDATELAKLHFNNLLLLCLRGPLAIRPTHLPPGASSSVAVSAWLTSLSRTRTIGLDTGERSAARTLQRQIGQVECESSDAGDVKAVAASGHRTERVVHAKFARHTM